MFSHGIHYNPRETITENITKFKVIAQKLVDAGDKVSETSLIGKILHVTPLKFSHFHSA